MRNLRGLRRPGLWQSIQGRGSAAGGQRAMLAWIKSTFEATQLARKARLNQRRERVLKALDTFQERRERSIATLRNRLQEGLDDQPSARYAGEEEAYIATEPYSTGAVSEAVRVNVGPQPSTQMLYSVFEDLKGDDFYRDGSVKVSVVNNKLEDRGYCRVDKDTIERASNAWSREVGEAKMVAAKTATKRKKKPVKKAKKTTKGA